MHQYTKPPMRQGIFHFMDKNALEEMGWSFFDDLDGDISAPDAIPSGGCSSEGIFGPGTSFIPREHEHFDNLLKKLRPLFSRKP